MLSIRRREFILLGGAAAAWPLAVRAEQRVMPVIGFLAFGSAERSAGQVRAFLEGLKEQGYVPGLNVTIEYRWAERVQSGGEQLQAMAADLIRHQAMVIVANGPGAVAAKVVTGTTPIVFYAGVDPVQAGLVASLNRPGGNLTGFTNLSLELGPKRLELLHEVVPTAKSMALLVNPATSIGAEAQSRELQTVARTLGLQFHVVKASAEHEFGSVFSTLNQLRANGLIISNDGLFINGARDLGALSIRHRVPTIFQFREFAAAGGLMSYGGSLADGPRVAGAYAGRILKGEKPADLPVQQATNVVLIINLKTAKALDIMVPLTLRGRADELIE
jgi:putative ABC transport system substrate-binding protein